MEVRKFQRISSNPQKIATHKANLEYPDDDGGGGGGGGGGGVGRFCGWPSSRIVRVSRASGGKDRHSKVLTSKGLRDRRVRLSVATAIQFYDLQDRLGYDQPSKAVEWLIKAAATSIAELPSLDPAFSGAIDDKRPTENDAEFEDPNYLNNHSQNNNNNNVSVSRSSACSSTSETSKGSGLSLSRSENRMKARERAREMAAKKEKEKESESTRAAVVSQMNGISQNSSFTDLLTAGISRADTAASPESRTHWTTPMDYFFGRPPPSSPQIIQMPQFNITAGDSHHNHVHPQPQFSFLQESLAATASGGPGFGRGTLQSNLSSFLPQQQPHVQRFQSYGSTSTNFPFFVAPNSVSAAPEQFPETGYYGQRLQPCYGGGDGGGRHSDHHKEKTKH